MRTILGLASMPAHQTEVTRQGNHSSFPGLSTGQRDIERLKNVVELDCYVLCHWRPGAANFALTATYSGVDGQHLVFDSRLTLTCHHVPPQLLTALR